MVRPIPAPLETRRSARLRKIPPPEVEVVDLKINLSQVKSPKLKTTKCSASKASKRTNCSAASMSTITRSKQDLCQAQRPSKTRITKRGCSDTLPSEDNPLKSSKPFSPCVEVCPPKHVKCSKYVPGISNGPTRRKGDVCGGLTPATPAPLKQFVNDSPRQFKNPRSSKTKAATSTEIFKSKYSGETSQPDMCVQSTDSIQDRPKHDATLKPAILEDKQASRAIKIQHIRNRMSRRFKSKRSSYVMPLEDTRQVKEIKSFDFAHQAKKSSPSDDKHHPINQDCISNDTHQVYRVSSLDKRRQSQKVHAYPMNQEFTSSDAHPPIKASQTPIWKHKYQPFTCMKTGRYIQTNCHAILHESNRIQINSLKYSKYRKTSKSIHAKDWPYQTSQLTKTTPKSKNGQFETTETKRSHTKFKCRTHSKELPFLECRPNQDKHLADQDKHLADQDKHLADQDKHLADQDKHLADQDKHLADQDKHLADRLTCHLCGLNFTGRSAIERHMVIHCSSKTPICFCALCNKTFVEFEHLEAHVFTCRRLQRLGMEQEARRGPEMDENMNVINSDVTDCSRDLSDSSRNIVDSNVNLTDCKTNSDFPDCDGDLTDCTKNVANCENNVRNYLVSIDDNRLPRANNCPMAVMESEEGFTIEMVFTISDDDGMHDVPCDRDVQEDFVDGHPEVDPTWDTSFNSDFVCEICGIKFPGIFSLTDHYWVHEPRTAPFEESRTSSPSEEVAEVWEHLSWDSERSLVFRKDDDAEVTKHVGGRTHSNATEEMRDCDETIILDLSNSMTRSTGDASHKMHIDEDEEQNMISACSMGLVASSEIQDDGEAAIFDLSNNSRHTMVSCNSGNLPDSARTKQRTQIVEALTQVSPKTSTQVPAEVLLQLSPMTSTQVPAEVLLQLSPMTSTQVPAEVLLQLSPMTSTQISPMASTQVLIKASTQVPAEVLLQLSPKTSTQVPAEVLLQLSPMTSTQISPMASTQVLIKASTQVSAEVSTQVSSEISTQVAPDVDDECESIHITEETNVAKQTPEILSNCAGCQTESQSLTAIQNLNPGGRAEGMYGTGCSLEELGAAQQLNIGAVEVCTQHGTDQAYFMQEYSDDSRNLVQENILDNFKDVDILCQQCGCSFRNNMLLCHAPCFSISKEQSEAIQKHIEPNTQITNPVNKCFYHCDKCIVTFPNREALVQHYESHIEGKECHICGEMIRTVEYRNDQQRCSAVCEVCEEPRLSRHDRTAEVAVEMTYRCPHCKKELDNMPSFIAHVSAHTGVFPFECRICKRGYRYKAALKFHMGHHHVKLGRDPSTSGPSIVPRRGLEHRGWTVDDNQMRLAEQWNNQEDRWNWGSDEYQPRPMCEQLAECRQAFSQDQEAVAESISGQRKQHDVKMPWEMYIHPFEQYGVYLSGHKDKESRRGSPCRVFEQEHQGHLQDEPRTEWCSGRHRLVNCLRFADEHENGADESFPKYKQQVSGTERHHGDEDKAVSNDCVQNLWTQDLVEDGCGTIGPDGVREHHSSVHGGGSWTPDLVEDGRGTIGPDGVRAHHSSVHGGGSWTQGSSVKEQRLLGDDEHTYPVVIPHQGYLCEDQCTPEGNGDTYRATLTSNTLPHFGEAFVKLKISN